MAVCCSTAKACKLMCNTNMCTVKSAIPMALQAFPHPLARLNAIKDTKVAGYRNYLSYMAVDEFTYTGTSGAGTRSQFLSVAY